MNSAQPQAPLYLRESHGAALVALLQRFLPATAAWAYGSRVNGTAHEASDLDVVLRSPNLEPIAPDRLSQFKHALRESNIPILVDVQDWARLPLHFQTEIQKRYVVLVGEPTQK